MLVKKNESAKEQKAKRSYSLVNFLWGCSVAWYGGGGT